MSQSQVPPCEVINIDSLMNDSETIGAQALVKSGQFQVLHLRVTPEKAIPEHAVDGPIIVQCLKGSVDFSIDGSPKPLKSGDWFYLTGGIPHGITAHEDSHLLVIRIMTDK